MKKLEEEYDQLNDGARTVESIEHELSVKARLRTADALMAIAEELLKARLRTADVLMAIAEELHQLNGPQII